MAGILSGLLGSADESSDQSQQSSVGDEAILDVNVTLATEYEYRDADGAVHGGRTEVSVSETLTLDGLLTQDTSSSQTE